MLIEQQTSVMLIEQQARVSYKC